MKFCTIVVWFCLASVAMAQASPQEQSMVGVDQQPNQKLVVTVIDENSVPVTSAQVILTRAQGKSVVKGETDYAGRREFGTLNSGLYYVQVEKIGFFAAKVLDVDVGKTDSIEVIISHEQELRESLNVLYSPPAIDLTKTSSADELSMQEIQNIPYSGVRDYRNALAYLPGVVQDRAGQIHLNGGSAAQNLNQFDGFNISHPADGVLALRASPDTFRSIEVKNSRYSAEYGKGSGGVVSLATRMGDDRTRFTITDFVPSFQFKKGLDVNTWTPRGTFSGPLVKQKSWFFDAMDGEYNFDVVNGAPAGADRTSAYRLNNVVKAQVNLKETNILTGSYVVNQYRSLYNGLSQFDPKDVTRELRQSASFFTVKDQAYFPGGMLLEVGTAFNQYRAREIPYGNQPYINNPTGRTGSYFRASDAEARRVQGIMNLTLPPMQAHGRHEFKLGLDVDRVNYDQIFDRRSITINRRNGTRSRLVTFNNTDPLNLNNTELSGYGQDRWSISDRWVLETGLRMDWDQIIRDLLLSPRIATSFLVRQDSETKVSLGAGIFYDASNLNLIGQPMTGRRFDQFYESDGLTPRGAQLQTVFNVDPLGLRAPRFINWSLGVEHKLPSSIYMHVELIERRGSGGLGFINQALPQPGRQSGVFQLGSTRMDRYDAVQLTLRRRLKENYTIFVSYTHSRARSNAILDVGLDNPVFGLQAAGPLPWDTPNNLVSWGSAPLFWRFDLVYALDWRDGFPFSSTNQDQQLVGLPNSLRYPRYFSLNLHAERRFRFLGYSWALRAGFNNITGNPNPAGVDNNVDSRNYLTFTGFQQRTFVGRVRFLGRK